MTEVKTFICLHCFTQIDVNTPVEIEPAKMLVECPICKNKIQIIPENADASKVKYHFNEIQKAMRVY